MTQPSEEAIRKACEEAGISVEMLQGYPEHGLTRALANALARRIETEREAVPVAWMYRWKLDGEYVNWRVSDASNYHKSLTGYEELPLYAAPPKEPTT